MTSSIAVLATLDTKGQEAGYLKQQLEALGSRAVLIDIGVMGTPAIEPDISREEVASEGGTSLERLLRHPSREVAAPAMAAGATKIIRGRVGRGEIHGIIGLGGLQGTALCTQVMREMPYGLPKVMVSTVASGDTSAYVGIADIAMMFSVGDILGLNPVTRKILANAAAAVHGMAQVGVTLQSEQTDKPLIGMTNLGVLTEGAMKALEYFGEAGYEAIVFHAVGSGGRAMEHMMKEGLIGAAFDYALGEIADELFDGLRAGDPERLTVAGKLGLPQVICPGGAEHLGILVDPPNTVPERWKDHKHVFHNPVVLAPRLQPDELVTVAREIGKRLEHTAGKAIFMIPLRGTGRYAIEGSPLRDAEGDRVFFEELKKCLPQSIEIVERDLDAEDPAFVKEAVTRLIAMIEG